MGLLRFILAMLVMLSHTGLTLGGLNPGVVSVVVFYAISGYVMSALIGKHFSEAGQAGHFYIDRLARIYPQYLLYAVATAVWFFSVGHTTPFLQHAPSGLEVLNNVLIAPLNFFMFNAADQFTLLPPAWSLGAEVLFYVLAPWLWRFWSTGRFGSLALWVAFASLAVQALAGLGVLPTDAWGYRLLPGVLWIFMAGMALQRLQISWPTLSNKALWLVPLVAVAAILGLQQQGALGTPYNTEVWLGIGIGLPAIQLLTQVLKLENPTWKAWDQRLGDLSYGIFLNHFFCMWVLDLASPQTVGQWLTLCGSSIALSYISQGFVERPCVAWRQNRRKAWHLARNALKIGS